MLVVYEFKPGGIKTPRFSLLTIDETGVRWYNHKVFAEAVYLKCSALVCRSLCPFLAVLHTESHELAFSTEGDASVLDGL